MSIKDIATLAYHAQSALRVCILIAQGKDKDQIICKHLDLFKEKSFGVEHIKILEDDMQSVEFAQLIGGQLQEQTNAKVNLKHPDVKVISCNDSEIFVGIDVVGFDMGKRPYKLMAYPGSVSGSFAYCLTRLAGVTQNSSVVDPFCGSATIPIETGLFQKRVSPFRFGKKLLGVTLFGEEFSSLEKKETKKLTVLGFDHQVRVMLAAQKNAKIAGIHEDITISKVAVDWVDAKFEEKSIDFIVTNPPKVNKRTNNVKQITKLYDELFYQAKYILKSKGTLAILLNKADIASEIATKHGFIHKETMNLMSGKQPYIFCIFKAP